MRDKCAGSFGIKGDDLESAICTQKLVIGKEVTVKQRKERDAVAAR